MTQTPDPTEPVTPAAPVEASSAPPAAPPYAAPPAYATPGAGSVGKVRGTGMCMLLFIVTLGFYSLYWFYATHDEMKRHSGQGIGGVLALVLAFFVGFVMPYITSAEVGGLYERQGKEKRVSGLTGLWYLPGALIVIGPIVWFVKTNAALNDYWTSQGAAA